MTNLDRIIGGIDKSSTKYVSKVYQAINKGNIIGTDSFSAEMSKLTENSYRDVVLAFANQIDLVCKKNKIDTNRLIKLANLHPRVNILKPSIGVGGHCIPVYPQLYLNTQPGAEIIRVARELNQSMPSHFIDKLEKSIGKLDGKEVAFSGAFSIQEILIKKGAKPKFLDPLYTSKELSALGFEPINTENSDVEVVIVHTHDNQTILNLKKLFPNCRIVLDGRGQVAGMNIPAGIEIIQL